MRSRAPFLASVIAILLVLAAAVPALAHAELDSSNPKAGSTVTDVQTVTLRFTEALERDGSSFKLIGPDGNTVGTGSVVSPKVMTLAGVSLGPGRYSVKWTAAAGDGHIERGRFSFTVDEPAVTPAPATRDPSTPAPATEAAAATGAPATEATEAATAAPVVTEPATTEGPATTEAPAAGPAAATSGTDILFPIFGLVVIVAVVGALVLRRSRQA